jgi:tetratricopeptide (TPR) repeat protein
LETKNKTSSRLVFYVFLFLFFGTAIFARWNIIQAPILNKKYDLYVAVHLKSSTSEILLSKHHRQIQIYKNAISNLLYKKFGVNEITFRTFSTIVSFLTLIFIFLFAQKAFGRVEALVAVLLFGVSYYSFITIKNPYYGGFNMLGSFLSFYFLFKGLEDNKHIHWLLLGVCSFLSITNVFLAGITLPVLFVVAVICLYRKWKYQAFSVLELKSRVCRFLIYLSVSTIAVLTLYQLRGLDLLGAFLDIAFTHEVDPKVNADFLGVEKTFYSGLFRLLYTVFVTFNFEHGDGSDSILGIPEGPWIYCFLFLVGLWSLFKSHRELFWSFMGIFLTPVIISGMILRITEARFLALIHPFYLITVALGFIFLLKWLKRFVASETTRNGIVLFCAYLVFVGGLHPKPLWGAGIYDELFKTEGIRSFRDYLRANIKENDLIINTTQITELRSDVGDALSLETYKYYLEEFVSKHRLELLPLKTGPVGLWLILNKPLENGNLVPFYFPGTYSPKLVKQVKGLYLYYGKIDIPKKRNVKSDVQFTTPFWSFFTGIILQNKKENQLAKDYYNVAIKHNLNLERIYYNLSFLYLSNLEIALDYMEKAIEIIETPTIVPDNTEINSWKTYGKDERGLPDVLIQLSKLRHFYLKKDGIKYKKWFIEDFINSKPSFFAGYYKNAIFYTKLLYSITGKKIYLKKIKNLYLRGNKLADGKLKDFLIEPSIESEEYIFHNNLMDLLGIYEIYPSIRRN